MQGYELNSFVKIHWIDSEDISKDNVKQIFRDLDGIIVPGGFGNRGVEGMITALRNMLAEVRCRISASVWECRLL